MKLLLILGNGFSIDFIKSCAPSAEIDISNLFSLGPQVRWPANEEPGFLSFRHCPNLWNLGARPTMSASDAIGLIEDIITCANVVASTKTPESYQEPNNQLYIRAYKELSLYLKHLFVYYDKKLNFSSLNIENWSWAKFFSSIHLNVNYSEVTIITYNYDVWLERILCTLEIPFNVSVIEPENPSKKFNILKPHGSISFAHEKCNDKLAFNIPYNREIHDAEASAFQIKYDDLNSNYLMNAIIPPAGDSSRLNLSWASSIRKEAKARAEKITSSDMVIICGLSYWHVDRAEIDELMVQFNQNINLKMINPAPPRSLNAVLTSLFSNYILHINSNILKELIND